MRSPLRMAYVSSVLVVGVFSCDSKDGAESRLGANAGPPTASTFIHEYVSRDANGERLSRSAWFVDAGLWIEEPAWDEYAVVSNFQFLLRFESADSGTVDVVYARTGSVIAAGDRDRFESTPETDTVRFIARRVDGRWRLASPVMKPHVLVTIALGRQSWTEEERRQISGRARAR